MYNRCIVVGMVATDCYILAADNADECVVIDPGADAERIMDEVSRSGRRLAAIMLTHGHFDHIGAVAGLIKLAGGNVLVYASEAEKELLADTSLNCSDAVRRPVAVSADNYFKDGDIINLAGLEFEVIATPGHTVGSVCFYVKEENVLFAGDTLFEMSVGRTDLPTGDGRRLVKSIKERLFVLPDNTVVYPGHGSSTDIAFEKKNNMYL